MAEESSGEGDPVCEESCEVGGVGWQRRFLNSLAVEGLGDRITLGGELKVEEQESDMEAASSSSEAMVRTCCCECGRRALGQGYTKK